MISEKNWAQELAKSLISLNQLSEKAMICESEVTELQKVKDTFDIRVPQLFIEDIIQGNTALAKQFIPSKNEIIFLPEELEDPIGDARWTPVEGIVHRYPDRVLFKPTYLCGVYCRFCFRRNKVSDASHNLKSENAKTAINYIKDHSEIWEVILTGGDPLVMTDKVLQEILSEIAAIDHVKVIRFHSRIPSVLPSRITNSLIQLLKSTNKSIWIAAHMNSADEFTPEAKIALAKLIDNGIPVLLQSVLLKEINDTHETLVSLFKVAIENRVKPYYIHYPDLAKGTEQFRIPLKKAIELVKGLRGTISGLCIPHFIIDIPGGSGKIAINTHTAKECKNNTWEFESPLDGTIITVQYPHGDEHSETFR
ncbi:KamA family radical SAM protein [Fluviispira multicolorata]|uniref:KamA family radical SAM protein n=1 Tax=Fluviispira multicolorata TaxID=2654512 RepID=A0A833JGF5_9BACT|nr:KamA family radical SAM protein [Fluviispira multicolorata]KAB8032056.1 KamA family radical SAM protein [Fluviispira multicolorata]